MYPCLICLSGVDLIAAFYGCLYAGVIPVTVRPPHPQNLAATLPTVRMIIDVSEHHWNCDMKFKNLQTYFASVNRFVCSYTCYAVMGQNGASGEEMEKNDKMLCIN